MAGSPPSSTLETENPAIPQQPILPKVVPHVLGTFRSDVSGPCADRAPRPRCRYQDIRKLEVQACATQDEETLSNAGEPSGRTRLGRPISYCWDSSDPALARLLGALLHVSGSIDDLQARNAPEGQQCRPRSIVKVAPDLERRYCQTCVCSR